MPEIGTYPSKSCVKTVERALRMQRRHQFATLLIFLLMVLTLVGLWRTRETVSSHRQAPSKEAKQGNASLLSVDQTPLKTAQQLAQLASTPEERTFALEAIRLADYEVDLAFDTALSEARLHPPPLSPEAKEMNDRLQKAEKLLKADQDRTKRLAELVVKVPEDKRDAVELDLIQAEADLDLDQDEVDDAKQDLLRAGGNLVDRIQATKKEHEELGHGNASAVSMGNVPPEELGFIHRAQQWTVLHQKQLQLWQARNDALASAGELSAQHYALEIASDAAKANTPDLMHHSKQSKTGEPVDRVSAANKSREESVSLLQKTEQIAADEKILTGLDKRIETQKELVAVYDQWISFVRDRQERVIHRMLFGCLIILAIALLGLYASSWLDSVAGKVSTDRRQTQFLRTISRVFLQFVAVLLILLVIFGPPGQLGTFLGLAGAGLTVALKDFIVGFIGWIMLMRKNGIRLGDWVEINGVTGEVVEIGPFHTVLLETGNWGDSGQPTGRRVTFTNSYAIEGHYFNFSTSGPWLWDELQVVLPAGQDPYPTVEAIKKKVAEATVEYSKQAEQEWRHATSSIEDSGFTAAPAVSLKPILGGVEISVRYITRASDKYKVRADLYHTALELVSG
jgi:small-conductance mechanosensitive channel